jgi:transcriptional regulator NrdR family protein
MKPCACKAKAYVVDSRPLGDNTRRRRECSKCGRRWTTLEVVIGRSADGRTIPHGTTAINILKSQIALEIYKEVRKDISAKIRKLRDTRNQVR